MTLIGCIAPMQLMHPMYYMYMYIILPALVDRRNTKMFASLL